MFDGRPARSHRWEDPSREDADPERFPPGRSTLTARLPASAHAIAQAIVGLQRPTPVEQVQAKGSLDGPDVHAVAAQGLTGSAGRLPFLEQIQRAFGHHDISGVRAHIGGPAAAAANVLNARAYASGDEVAFASEPDLHLAAHEAAHVVQQRGGVRLSGGVGRSGDEYERHADQVADAVVRGESAEALLDRYAHRGAAGGPAVQKQEGGRRDDSDSQRLVQRARELDAQLMRGDLPRPQQIQIARQLIQIYETLQQRIQRGEFQPHQPGDPSPLAGLLDDVPPFGNLDMWIAIAGEQRRARRARPRQPQQQEPNQPEQPQSPGGDGGDGGSRPAPSADARSGGDLSRGDIRPDNVEPSTAGAVLDRTALALDIIGALTGAFLFEAAGAIVGPMLSMASHVIALEQGVENHERAGRSLGVRATLKYTIFTRPAPRTITVEAVYAFYTNDPHLQRERNSLTTTGISAGNRIDIAIRDGMTRASTSINTAVSRCEQEFRRRLAAANQGEPTQEELQQLRRAVYEAVYNRLREQQGGGGG